MVSAWFRLILYSLEFMVHTIIFVILISFMWSSQWNNLGSCENFQAWLEKEKPIILRNVFFNWSFSKGHRNSPKLFTCWSLHRITFWKSFVNIFIFFQIPGRALLAVIENSYLSPCKLLQNKTWLVKRKSKMKILIQHMSKIYKWSNFREEK